MKTWDVYVNGSNVGTVESSNYKTARRSALDTFKPKDQDSMTVDLSNQKFPVRALGLVSHA